MVTDQELHVDEYSKALNSAMMLPYVLILDMVQRLKTENLKTALDLCCGPGHFTRMLVEHLDCDQVTGVDLSAPMLDKARENADKEKFSQRLSYSKANVTSLDRFESKSFDVVSFMDGAHHLPSLEDVHLTLKEAHRVAKADGVIILIDPVRQKTERLTRLYHKIVGETYIKQGLTHFNKDFIDSLYASWTPDELFTAIPQDTDRRWIQLVPFGFAAFQVIIGLPAGREKIFIGKKLSATIISKLILRQYKADWRILLATFRLAKMREVVNQPVSAPCEIEISRSS